MAIEIHRRSGVIVSAGLTCLVPLSSALTALPAEFPIQGAPKSFKLFNTTNHKHNNSRFNL